MAPPRRSLGTITQVQPAKRQVRVAVREGYRDTLEQLKTLEVELRDGERLRCRIASVTWDNQDARVAFVAGVTRDNVARLRGATVMAPEDAEPNRAEGFALDDVLGFAVVDTNGETVGTVRGVMDTKAGGILEIETTAGGALLLPAIPEAISGIDWDTERIVVGDIAPYAVGTDEE